MRAARIALLLTAGLVPAASAHADVMIGSDLTAPVSSLGTRQCAAGCTYSNTAVPGRPVAAPARGVITRWRIRGGPAVPVHFVILRRPSGPGGPAQLAFRSAAMTPAAADVTTEVAPVRIPIMAGEYIGIETPAGVSTNYFAEPVPSDVDIWSAPVTTDLSPPPNTTGTGLEVLVNADVEPDIDGDGNGDTTQDTDDDGDGVLDTADNCPVDANAGQQNADGDTLGDACDGDRDGDGVGNAADVCPAVAGPAPRGCPVTPTANRAPTVRFRTPLAGTAIGPSFRIQLDVADDRGSPTVSVFDDDGTICTLRRAPYACTWTPTGADVGRATLLASAVDSAGLSTLGIVRVRVNRFAASLTLRQRHRKGVTRVTGRLVLPPAVTRAQGCSGTVKVRLRKARRTAKLTRRCTYSARLPFRPGRARVTFGGNAVIAPT
jgi:Thrombospondin type 3 repeat/Bacterial Ig domain